MIWYDMALNVNPKKWFHEIHFVHANHAKELLEMLLGEAGWWVFTHHMYVLMKFTLWWTNIAIENGPFIDGLPIKHGDFPLLCLFTRG